MTDHPHSTAAIGGHPIHPMLVPFPIAFLVATFVCDLVFWRTQAEGWAISGMWVLGAGIVAAALAAVVGFVDFFGEKRIRALSDAWMHMIANGTVAVLSIVSFYLRWRYGAVAAILPWGLVLSTVVFALLLFSGWKGGELVFRHHVGMVDESERRAVAGESYSPVDRRAHPAE